MQWTLGARYSVRYRLKTAADTTPDSAAPLTHCLPHQPSLTDAIGYLRGLDSERVTLETRKHGTVTIERASIVAAKQVPEPPQRRATRRPA
ncbi:hypothetical protein JT358_12565 [Micrococcales bacterium 31B]|nr:hypothetical protein [Micrococcales bacterium 31B]